jgi:radical SAM protein with 4Fe4S-binding SPASM domain
MKFNKIYIELTNICGLECSFCPTKILQNKTIPLKDFETILKQVKNYTKVITFHIFGDPLTLSNLEKYLDLTHQYNLKVELVTTGYYLNNFNLGLFLHPAIKQINFSLNSYNKNEMDKTLENYLEPMFQLCELKLEKKIHNFINFRLWNLDNRSSDKEFNNIVLQELSKYFKIDLSNITYDKPIRLENQILIDFDNYFEWPSLQSNHNTHAPCYGLRSHFGILASGKVVPCCLDSYGCIDLGNIFDTPLDTILSSQKVQSIISHFKEGIAIEELCQKCSFKDRFLAKN